MGPLSVLGADWDADRARCGPKALIREQSLWAIAVYRAGRRVQAAQGLPRLPRKLLLGVLWQLQGIVETITGVSLPFGAEIGGGLRIYHFGGIFVNNGAVLGTDCTLRQGVTIGERAAGGPLPVIGDRVELGAYAQVLGGVRIGSGARIGAMSLVLDDVPPDSVAMGIPARSKDRSGTLDPPT